MNNALFSLHDITNAVSLAKSLVDLGWEISATEETLCMLQEAGMTIRLHELDSRMDFPESSPFQLLVSNLPPTYSLSRSPTMETDPDARAEAIRTAARNHQTITVLTNPKQYGTFLDKIREYRWTDEDRLACAQEAFLLTAAWDVSIAEALAGCGSVKPIPNQEHSLPTHLALRLVADQSVRYGENPHQRAAFFREPGTPPEGLAACDMLQGKDLSFNNMLDIDGAARTVFQFAHPACVIVKHNNPCGVGCGPHALEAFLKAQATDPASVFGGIAAFNRPVGMEVAQAMVQNFWEMILAPAFTPEALELFSARKQMRVIRTPGAWPLAPHGLDIRTIGGGYLVQRPDAAFISAEQWRVKATGRGPKPRIEDLHLAQTVAKAVKSNAIVLVKDGGTVGIGAGQMSRLDAVDIACRKAGARSKGAVLGSDGFFPFAEGIERAARHGVGAVVEPGGSLRDPEIIAAAQRLGLWLFFTGMRHFRH